MRAGARLLPARGGEGRGRCGRRRDETDFPGSPGVDESTFSVAARRGGGGSGAAPEPPRRRTLCWGKWKCGTWLQRSLGHPVTDYPTM